MDIIVVNLTTMLYQTFSRMLLSWELIFGDDGKLSFDMDDRPILGMEEGAIRN